MAWLTGWTYRKSITLNRASGAVANYQMELLVGESAGAVGEDVDCAAHVQPDFDDLRFTDGDGITHYGNHGGLMTTVGANTLHTFIGPGSTFTFKPCKNGYIKVEAWGAGGGGGIIASSGGGGGGGGAYACSNAIPVVAGVTYTIVVGLAGIAEVAGGDSTFEVTVVVADGGTGAADDVKGLGGTVANSTGDVRFAGGDGGTGLTTDDCGGGGGGAGGKDGAGVNGQDATSTTGGHGGAGDNSLGGAGGVDVPGGSGLPGVGNVLGGGGAAGGDNGFFGGVGGNPGGGGGGGEITGGQTGGGGQVIITCVTADFQTDILDYHIKLITGATPNQLATVRIEFPLINTGATTFYMYYGKADAVAVSSGPNTYAFFEKFDSLNTANLGGQDGWISDSITTGETVTVAVDQYVSSPKSGKVFANAASDMYVGGARLTSYRKKNQKLNFSIRAAILNYHTIIFFELGHSMIYLTMAPDTHWKYYDGTMHNLTTDTLWAQNTWYEVEITVREDNTWDVAIGGVTKLTGAPFLYGNMVEGMDYFWFGIIDGSVNTDTSTWVDDIILRHFLATGPAWGAWGAEETEPPPPSGTGFVAWIN